LALLVLAAPSAAAQSEPVATRPTSPPVPVLDTTQIVVTQQGAPQRLNCWRARKPCPLFFLTDLGIEFPVAQSRHPDALAPGGRGRDFADIRPVWTIGFLGTKGRHSHGPTASLVGEDVPTGLPFMLEYRYRNWLGESAALDLSLGYKRNGFYESGLGLTEGKGLTTMIAWTPNRWIGLSARGDFMRAANRDRRALLLGVQSTRVSEEFFKLVLVTAIQALLEKIGVDTSDDEG